MSTTNSNLLLLSKEIIGIVCQIGELVNVTADSTATTVLETVKCMYVGQRGALNVSHACAYLSIKMPQGTHTRRLQGTGTNGVDSASVQGPVVLIPRLCKTTAVAVKWELARCCSRMMLRKTTQRGPTVSLGTAASNESVVPDPSDR